MIIKEVSILVRHVGCSFRNLRSYLPWIEICIVIDTHGAVPDNDEEESTNDEKDAECIAKDWFPIAD